MRLPYRILVGLGRVAQSELHRVSAGVQGDFNNRLRAGEGGGSGEEGEEGDNVDRSKSKKHSRSEGRLKHAEQPAPGQLSPVLVIARVDDFPSLELVSSTHHKCPQPCSTLVEMASR
eukprot:70926-Hanusia_phi.AAC.1